ncbi:MAG: hypothetical protein QXY40_09680 [Candidatus Methanomethylicia archaeon]
MSRTVLLNILNDMQILLSSLELEQLYRELTIYFGIAGMMDECEVLENAWRDPYNRREIEEFIKAWLRRRKARRVGEATVEYSYLTLYT